ncbi:hypothetical protein [Bacillus sinesaloumensis]|uniref:hypothetical protein n=1 Tax=Litchfieldia sinesaloumensis TaxID=1926280 RepID=UPI0009884025|nr:hypothetical protein [Bacillus sinesaloumensis]
MKGSYTNKSFPRFQLNEAQKSKIVQQIRINEPKNLNNSIYNRFIIPFLSAAVMIFLLSGTGWLAYQSIVEKELLQGVSSITINLPEQIIIQEEGSEYIFLKNGNLVGGIIKIDTDKKQELLAQPGIYENDLIEDFQEPTQRVLFHVKQMHAIQTVHYFIQPNKQEVIYDVYFHIIDPGHYGESDIKTELDTIHEIAKTFKINE